MALSGEGLGCTVVDMVDIVQGCMDMQDFSALPIEIKNCKVQISTEIRDEIFKLYFPSESSVVLFHKERQAASERPEAYLE